MSKTAQSALPSFDALSPQIMVELFEQLPEVAFFVKDRTGRYTAVNGSLLRRVGLRERADLLGKTVSEVFPSDLSSHYEAQDAEVLRTGRPVRDHLELHWYADRQRGWCLTTKLPLRDSNGRITGLVGISRDVRPPGETEEIPTAIGGAIAWLQAHYGESVTAAGLARHARMAPARFARLTKRLFGLSPQQMIAQTRLQAAALLLESTPQSIAEIAISCGFADHSAFTRAFKSALGRTPSQHRSGGDSVRQQQRS